MMKLSLIEFMKIISDIIETLLSDIEITSITYKESDPILTICMQYKVDSYVKSTFTYSIDAHRVAIFESSFISCVKRHILHDTDNTLCYDNIITVNQSNRYERIDKYE